MDKKEFIHELKAIIQLQVSLRHSRDRLIDVEEKLIQRTNRVLDIATENWNE